MNTNHHEFYRATYEYQADPITHEFPLYHSLKDPLYKTSQEKFSNSPPIILCETGGSRSNKTHKHRYLFYPSASRLSPFTDNNNNYLNNYNIIKNSLRNEKYFKEGMGNEKNLNNKNETTFNKNEKSPEKYQAMYDKSFELVKRISELLPEEKNKLKGNSDYYLTKDKDYMNIIDNQIDSLTNHFKNNNFNLGYKTDGYINKNGNLNIPNDENQMTYDQYKNNLLQRIKNSNSVTNSNDYNFNYKENNNIEENKDFKNNMENEINNNNNRNYINDYINDLNVKDNKNEENIEINEPEIQYQANLRNKNIKENKNENKNKNNYIDVDSNKEEQKYENQKDENNNKINNEGGQLMNNNIENDLNENDNQKKEEPLINANDKKISQSTKYNTLGMIQGTNDNININPNQNQQFENNTNTNNNMILESKNLNKGFEDPNTNNFPPYQLVDENNNQIVLSPESQPFIGELIEDQYQKGNQIFIKTKSGSDIKLNILRSKEGEPLTYKGYPLMGNEQKFFYDKEGNIIVYPDNEFIKRDKSIQVGVQDGNNKNNFIEFCINKNNFDLFGTDTGEEFRGSGSGGFKKSKKKNKWYMFPKGDGGAKAPMINKRKKRTKRFK